MKQKKILLYGIFLTVFLYATPVLASNPLTANLGDLPSSFFNLFSNYWDSYTSELTNIFFQPEAIPVTTPEVIIKVVPPVTPPITPPVIPPAPSVIYQNTTTTLQGPQGPTGPQGPAGPQGPRGPAGSGGSSSVDTSLFVLKTFFTNQVNAILTSIEDGLSGLSSSLAKLVNTITLTVTGSASIGGDLTVTGNITGNVIGTINPSFTLGSVPFQGATGLTEDNANLSYNDTTNILSAAGFSGPLTGNVTGNLTGTASGNPTNSAGANIIPKSNGTNLVASSITDNGTLISTTLPISAENFKTPATKNTVVGSGAFAANATGASNIVMGYSASSAATALLRSVIIGEDAGDAAVNHTDSVVIGYRANQDISGAVKYGSIAIGVSAFAPGNESVVIGAWAGGDGVNAQTETTAVGGETFYHISNGGIRNSAFGYLAGAKGNDSWQGNYNTFLGANAVIWNETGFTSTNNNNTLIGANVRGPASVDNLVVLGDDNVTEIWGSEDAGATFRAGGYAGGNASATAGNTLFSGQNGLGTNKAGGNATIQPGLGTGNATSSNLYFATGNAGASGTTLQTATTKMTILGSGNVGIGETSPSGKLAITQTATATGALKGIVYTGSVNTNQTLSTEIPSLTLTTAGRQWATGALATQREVLITQPTYSFVGASTITDAATLGIAGAPVAGTNATLTNSYGLLIQSGAVAAGTANSYGLTVNAQTGAPKNYAAVFLGGEVGTGIANPAYIFEVTGTPAAGSPLAYIANTLAGTTQNNGLLILAGNDTGVAASEMITFKRPDATVIGSVSQNAAGTVAYNLSSDRRIKDNVTPTAYGLADLMKINVNDFTFISDSNKTKMTGFIAQELNAIYPMAVTTNGDNGEDSLALGKTPWMIDYSKLSPLIVKAVQEMDLKITDINNLEKENDWRDNLIAWFANAENRIARIFTGEVCLTEAGEDPVCLNRAELQSLKALLNQNTPASEPLGSSTTGDAAPTPDPAPEPTPEPEITPEPITTPPEEPAPLLDQGGDTTSSPPLEGGVPEGGGGSPAPEPTPTLVP